MKALVVRAYTDRIDKTVHHPNTEVELSAERLEELARKGFVEPAPGPDGAGSEAGGPEDAGGEGAALDSMTKEQLKALISSKGGIFPKDARKAELVAIAEGL